MTLRGGLSSLRNSAKNWCKTGRGAIFSLELKQSHKLYFFSPSSSHFVLFALKNKNCLSLWLTNRKLHNVTAENGILVRVSCTSCQERIDVLNERRMPRYCLGLQYLENLSYVNCQG